MVEPIDAIGALVDPLRRELYRYVADSAGEVGRDEAAAAVGVSRSLVAFHLDKLVDAGLLAVAYKRLHGRTGPGAGRPAKLYRRAEGERSVSVPPRDYGAAARLLATVVEEAGLDRELQAAARAAGAAASTVDDAEAAQATGIEAVLAERGYQPYWDGATLRLRNCPFHVLSRDFPPLVCGMNLALIEGLLGGAEEGRQWMARMDPQPDTCCVALKTKTKKH